MYHTDTDFQALFFLAGGILSGGISSSLFISVLLLIIYEFYIFHISRFYPPAVKEFDRFLFNLLYIFGWIIGRILMLNETGFEDVFAYF